MMSQIAFLACLASTLFMSGVIWFVEVVHYPLLDQVGRDGFAQYHAAHTRLTSRVVLVPMVIELASSAWLVWDRPRGMSLTLACSGLLAAGLTWAVTFFCSVPAHNHLAAGFDPGWYRWLVATNPIRAWVWTAHSAILLFATYRQIN